MSWTGISRHCLSVDRPKHSELLLHDGNVILADIDIDAGCLLPLKVELISDDGNDDGKNADDVPPTLVIMFISFAYLEEDGVLLCIALVAALASISFTAATVWAALRATGMVERLLGVG